MDEDQKKNRASDHAGLLDRRLLRYFISARHQIERQNGCKACTLLFDLIAYDTLLKFGDNIALR